MNPAARRLLDLARQAEDAHLEDARAAVLAQYRRVRLSAAEKALAAALSLPRGQRPAALQGVLRLIGEAAQATRTPPADLLRLMRRAVRDRVLNAADLAVLTDPALLFPNTGELQAQAVTRQRAEMNRYWAKETVRFRQDVAATIRDAARRGLDAERAADLLQERLDVSRSRAVLIASDQLLTAAAYAERQVLQAAGVKRFLWHTQGDDRVRPAHRALNGKTFTWRGAPELPGQAVRCRCRALPTSARR